MLDGVGPDGLVVSRRSAVGIVQTGTIQAASCDWAVGDADRTIELNSVYQGSVPASGGIGFKAFTLTLQSCSAGTTAATFTFAGTSVTSDPLRYLNTGDATGVALELQSSDQRTIGANGTQNARTVSVVGGNAALPLQVGYWRLTGQAVTPGAVSAVATITLGYN